MLLKLIGEVEPSTVRVRIGDENEIDNLRSGVRGEQPATGRARPSSEGSGCSAPTRMDYPGTIATVRAVARYVGDLWPELGALRTEPWPRTTTGFSG